MVYGRPAIVGAVDLRLSARLARTGATDGGVRIRVPTLGVDETSGWSSLLDYARTARERWQAFAARPGAVAFGSVRGDDPAHVVKIALGETAAFLGGSPGPLELEVAGELPIGSGFGSSAAAAIAVVAGYLVHRGADPDAATVDRLALEVERRQHGLPSGVDHATVLRGGLLWARRRDDGAATLEPLTGAPAVLSGLRVFDSGRPAESTGVVVAAVRERLQADRGWARSVLDGMEEATRAFRDQLEAERHDPAIVIETLKAFEARLEELGVVPAPIAQMVRGIEAAGGAAKVSGAGALGGSSAGGVLVYHPDGGAIDAQRLAGRMRELPVRLGAEGFRVESEA